MLEMIMEMFSSIINSVVIYAVLDLVVTAVPVVLLSSLLVLVLTSSVNSILLLVKNSILSKAMVWGIHKYPIIRITFPDNFQPQAFEA